MYEKMLSLVPLRFRPYFTQGVPPRATPISALRVIYGLWFAAFTLKLIGSSWDMAWHFRYLRDDLAPPHIINTIGTFLAIGLVIYHTLTGFGITKRGLLMVQAGMGTFLLAIPLDLLNHAIFGLDITSWSPTHALLYLGTAVMLIGVLDGWLELAEPGQGRRVLALGFAVFFLENILFPLGQQEYGRLALEALWSGAPTADNELLAAGGANIAEFALPVPNWVYPLWLIGSTTLTLLVARSVVKGQWTATTIAVGYLAYRLIGYGLLRGANFPPSFIPWMLLPGALAIDLTARWQSKAMAVALAVVGVFYVAAVAAGRIWLMPEFPILTAPIAVGLIWAMYRAVIWVERNVPQLATLRSRA